MFPGWIRQFCSIKQSDKGFVRNQLFFWSRQWSKYAFYYVD
uniref:Uncharacterized protein n=1 Tax=Rhizophora mucronata TaxID=61149 RepID=A0A2P2R246_RHIMU